MKLVIASNNFHKIEEIKDILGFHFESIQSMREAHIELDVDENADSFMGNARLKAAACARLLPGYAVLADDSGLCVDALNGEPGVCSARYAGSGHNDAENRQKLLHNLRNVPLDKREAHFACAMVLILPDGSEINSYGTVDGRILFGEKGENGFGYDSLFLYEPAGKTFAEISPALKNQVSHRRNALMLMLGALNEKTDGRE